jgi:hypothetical protein
MAMTECTPSSCPPSEAPPPVSSLFDSWPLSDVPPPMSITVNSRKGTCVAHPTRPTKQAFKLTGNNVSGKESPVLS